MNYRLDVWTEEGYLYAHVDGERTADNIASAARAIAGACLRHQIDSVLVDVRDFPGHISIFESFMIPARLFPTLKQLSAVKRAAIVDDRKRRERFEFFEGVARKGGYNVRAFGDLESAIAWLQADRKAASPRA